MIKLVTHGKNHRDPFLGALKPPIVFTTSSWLKKPAHQVALLPDDSTEFRNLQGH